MRIILLVVLEIAAVFGIPRAIYEVRTALGTAPPPAVRVVHIANDAQPPKAAPAKPAKAGEVEKALLLQASQLPPGRAVAKLPPPPQARRPAEDAPAQERAAPASDDDYLPPWMRAASAAAKHDPSQPGSVRVAVAEQKVAPARQVRNKRHSDTYGYSGRSRRSQRVSAYPWGF
jgi:hypothetical protein